jgi:hypothetical protein
LRASRRRSSQPAANRRRHRGLMMRWIGLGLIVAMILPARIALAHGTVGQRTFIEPIVAEDANPKNEWDILAPAWHQTAEGREFSIGFSLEKKLSENSSLLIGSEWLALSPKEEAYSQGFDNMELLYKYAFLTSPEHELRLSIAAGLDLPTGDKNIGAETHPRIGPEFLWAWGFGDIPNRGWLKYLRPFAIQGDAGYTFKTSGQSNDGVFADNVLEYSLPYLSDFVRDVGLPWPVRNLIPYTEFNYDQIVTGRTRTTFPGILVTPGIAFMNHWIEISVATQFAVNNATVPENHAAVLGLLDLFIDDIWPRTNWTPFR